MGALSVSSPSVLAKFLDAVELEELLDAVADDDDDDDDDSSDEESQFVSMAVPVLQ